MTPEDIEVGLPWLVDLDGTLCRPDLGSGFVSWLRRNKLSKTTLAVECLTAPVNLGQRLRMRGNVLAMWATGCSAERLDLIDEYLESHGRQIEINLALLDLVRQKAGSFMVLTGSWEPLVSRTLERVLTLYPHDVSGMTFRRSPLVERNPYGKDKLPFAPTDRLFVGVGNSWPDRYLLEKASASLIVRGDKRLERLAQQNNWVILKSNFVPLEDLH